MSNKVSTRRSFLTTAVSLSVVGVGETLGARSEPDPIDTSFDPTRDSAIRSFADRFRRLSGERQQAVFESLTNEQRTALKRAFAPERVEFDRSSPQQKTAQASARVRSVSAKGWSLLGYHLWTWTHRVRWTHDGTTVRNVQSSDFAAVYDPTWAYQGTTSKSKTVTDDRFEVFRQGKLTFLGGRFTLSASPYARIRGDATGASSVVAVDDGY